MYKQPALRKQSGDIHRQNGAQAGMMAPILQEGEAAAETSVSDAGTAAFACGGGESLEAAAQGVTGDDKGQGSAGRGHWAPPRPSSWVLPASWRVTLCPCPGKPGLY